MRGKLHTAHAEGAGTLQRELSDVRGYQSRLEGERDEARAAAAAASAELAKQGVRAAAAAETAARELGLSRQETASATVSRLVESPAGRRHFSVLSPQTFP